MSKVFEFQCQDGPEDCCQIQSNGKSVDLWVYYGDVTTDGSISLSFEDAKRLGQELIKLANKGIIGEEIRRSNRGE